MPKAKASIFFDKSSFFLPGIFAVAMIDYAFYSHRYTTILFLSLYIAKPIMASSIHTARPCCIAEAKKRRKLRLHLGINIIAAGFVVLGNSANMVITLPKRPAVPFLVISAGAARKSAGPPHRPYAVPTCWKLYRVQQTFCRPQARRYRPHFRQQINNKTSHGFIERFPVNPRKDPFL